MFNKKSNTVADAKTSNFLLDGKSFNFNDIFVNFLNKTLSFGNELYLTKVVSRTKSFVYLRLNKVYY